MRNPKFIIIVGLNILLLILAIWLKPRFQTNDDIGMIYAYSGTAIFDEPTPVTAFSTKIWGMLMVGLYKVAPAGIEVYTIVFFLLIFLANIAIHKKLLESLNEKSFLFWLFFIPILILITINFYLELQFTMLAGLLCFAGVFLHMQVSTKQERVIGYLLVLLGVLVRPNMTPIIISFLFLIYLSATYILPLLMVSRKIIFISFGIFALLFCIIFFIDNALLTKKEKQFNYFNLYRASIVDFSNDQSLNNSIPESWDKNDVYLFKNWFYNDSILYSDTKDYSTAGNNQKNEILNKINNKNLQFFAIVRQFKDPFFRCIIILAIAPFFFIYKWKRVACLFIIIFSIYFLYYNLLAIFLKAPPFRVSYLMFSSGVIIHLYFAIRLIEKRSFNLLRLTLAGLLVSYCLLITKISFLYRMQDILNTRCIEKYDPAIMYIRWAGYPFELVDPFKVSTHLHAIKIISMGAFSIHPALNHEFGKFKYKNLTKDIIGKDALISFMMPPDTMEWKGFRMSYTAFMAKHYQRNVFFEKVDHSGHCYGYMEYKLKEKSDAKLD